MVFLRGPKEKKVIDTHGGFLLEIDPNEKSKHVRVTHEPGKAENFKLYIIMYYLFFNK